MVCDRCKTLVIDALNKIGIIYDKVSLGELHLSQKMTLRQFVQLKELLYQSGFELLDEEQNILIENLMNSIDDMIDFPENAYTNIDSEHWYHRHYLNASSLNRLFSDVECISIEKYIDEHKISKIKRMLSYNELSIAQIANIMHYKSTEQFYGQFKSITGLNPAYFKKLRTRLPYYHGCN